MLDFASLIKLEKPTSDKSGKFRQANDLDAHTISYKITNFVPGIIQTIHFKSIQNKSAVTLITLISFPMVIFSWKSRKNNNLSTKTTKQYVRGWTCTGGDGYIHPCSYLPVPVIGQGGYCLPAPSPLLPAPAPSAPCSHHIASIFSLNFNFTFYLSVIIINSNFCNLHQRINSG